MSQKSPKKADLLTEIEYIYEDKLAESLARNQARVDACKPNPFGENQGKHIISKQGPPSPYELKRDASNAYPGLKNYFLDGK